MQTVFAADIEMTVGTGGKHVLYEQGWLPEILYEEYSLTLGGLCFHAEYFTHTFDL